MANQGRYPWMKFFPKDFIADTANLDEAETGCYSMMICRAWDMDGKLPFEVASIARLIGFKERIVKSTIRKLSESKLMYEEDGFLRLQFVDRELERVEKVRQQKASAGRESGKVRKLRLVGGDE